MGQEDEKLLHRVEDGVGTITFNRPARLNAFDLELAERFVALLDAWRDDAAVRTVVLRGAGRAFSAGGDVEVMKEMVTSGADRSAFFRAPLATFNRMVLGVWTLPKPVLAAVHGAAAGVAFNLVLACDLRLAAAGTRFTQAFVKLGLSPDGGGTFFLPRLIGHARAAELAMLPGGIDADRALEWGLVNWVVPADELEARCSEVARTLASGPTRALARTKALLHRGTDELLQGQLEAERQAQVDNAADADFVEGVLAFAAKRPPAFQGK